MKKKAKKPRPINVVTGPRMLVMLEDGFRFRELYGNFRTFSYQASATHVIEFADSDRFVITMVLERVPKK